ncbi:hypothetical protein J6590_067574 [Homalodisca vitripennis]|nr:hypothetical protein J6590_067574 [Homalodisca vitripennis]
MNVRLYIREQLAASRNMATPSVSSDYFGAVCYSINVNDSSARYLKLSDLLMLGLEIDRSEFTSGVPVVQL